MMVTTSANKVAKPPSDPFDSTSTKLDAAGILLLLFGLLY